MTEIWKELPGWEGYYAVSNQGRIKRLAGSPMCVVDRALKPQLGAWGYLMVSISRNHSKPIGVYIHRAVLQAFVGPAPSNKHVGNHLNGIKSDNRVENLEWATHRQNIQHAVDNGLRVTAHGVNHGNSKLTDDIVRQILEMAATRVSRNDICSRFNIATQTLDGIMAGTAWKHIKRPDMSGKKSGNEVLTPDKVAEIKRRLASGSASGRQIAQEFGVSPATVCLINTGKTWSHIKV